MVVGTLYFQFPRHLAFHSTCFQMNVGKVILGKYPMPLPEAENSLNYPEQWYSAKDFS